MTETLIKGTAGRRLNEINATSASGTSGARPSHSGLKSHAHRMIAAATAFVQAGREAVTVFLRNHNLDEARKSDDWVRAVRVVHRARSIA